MVMAGVGNDYAELDAQMFPDDPSGAAVDAPAPQQEVAPVPQRGDVALQPDSDPSEERFRRLENTIQAATRQMRRVVQERGTAPDTMTQKLDELTQQFQEMKEQREFESLTLEEQNERLREQRDAARKGGQTKQTQTQMPAITRTEPWFVDFVTDQYHDEVVPELRQMAGDMGLNLTQAHIDNVLAYALTKENGPAIVERGGQQWIEWDAWLRTVIRDSMRAEAKKQAETAPTRRPTSPARQTPAALGNGSRAAAGGTQRLDYFNSSLSQELNAAGWGDV